MDIAVIVAQKSVRKGYRYNLGFLRTVLALSKSIQFASEGYFLDDEHYNCAKRFVKHK